MLERRGAGSGARLASAGSASLLGGAVPSLMAAVLAALVELFLQPIKLKASNAEALIRPNVRTNERFVIVRSNSGAAQKFVGGCRAFG